MKVRFLVAVGGNDFSHAPDEVVEFEDDSEAAKWADGIRAEAAPKNAKANSFRAKPVEPEPEPTEPEQTQENA